MGGPGRSGGDAKAQLVEATAHGIGRHAEEAGDGPQVLGADGDHATVEVLALDLDHAQEAAQEVTFGPCWPVFATDSELVKDITASDDQLKNSCPGLLAKKALSGVRLAKCQKVSP